MGDFNKSDLNYLVKKNSFNILNKKGTRKGVILDLIMTNLPKCYHCINKPPLGKGDHDIVMAIPFLKVQKSQRRKDDKILKRTGKISDTVEEIGNINWSLLINSNKHSTEDKFNIFYETVYDIMDVCQPLKKSRIKSDQPWMTEELKALIIKRKKLFKKNHDEKWKHLCNKIKYKINQCKKNYYKKFTNKDTDWWKEVKKLSCPTS